MFIFRSLGPDCVRFLPAVIPAFLYEIRMNTETALRDQLFKHLSTIVLIAKIQIRQFSSQIFGVALVHILYTRNF